MRVSSILRDGEALLERWSSDEARFIDFAIQFREVVRKRRAVVPTGRTSPVYGGVWDRFAVDADGSVGDWSTHRAARPLVLDVSPKQFGALTDDTSRHLLIIGSRRSSKTETLARWVLKQCCRFPRKPISVLVQKRAKARTLVADKILPLLPLRWLAQKRAPVTMSQDQTSIDLIHGGKVRFLTGKVADDARGDGIPALGVDERQIIDREAVENALLSVSEGGGGFQTIETGTALAGEFEDYVTTSRGNPTYNVIELSVTDNIFLDTEHDPITGCDLPPFIVSARANMDPERFAREVGDWDPIGKRFVPRFVASSALVHWPFDRHTHVRSISDAVDVLRDAYKGKADDVTKRVTVRMCSAPHAYVCGVDFRAQPLCAVVLRLFSVGKAGVPDVAWVVDEIILEDSADATRLGRKLADRGYQDSMLIIDAAGKFSEGGKSSLRMLREQRYDVRAPQKNPHPQDAINAINAKLLNAENVVSLFIDGRCTRLAEALASHRYAERSYKPARDDHVNVLRALSWALSLLYPAGAVARTGTK